MQSFHDWLANCAQEAAQADRLATLIASAGAAGISLDHLRTVVRLSPNTLADLLRALTATWQVVVVKISGKTVYRATC
jgi:2',3'-cyclic-nucleotide 2'-phosphodiesterase (5'-nucleotidase family)